MFFTADLHLFHNRLIKDRGYETAEDMHDDIVKKWNLKISKSDIVYVLGDVSMLNKPYVIKQVLQRLKYKELILIKGNHDGKKVIDEGTYTNAYDYKELNYKKIHIVLSHYPFATWNRSHYGSINLHGHCHGRFAISKQQMDVGMDTNEMNPYHIDECINKMLLCQ